MIDSQNNPITEAVDQFLDAPTGNTGNPSLGASVPKELTAILSRMSYELGRKAPDRQYTAAQIASIAKDVYNRKAGAFSQPEILGNIRAFGRYLQQANPNVTGFTIEGSMGNRRTYKPYKPSLES